MKRRIAVRAIIVHEGKLLCATLHTDNGTADYWSTIGGGVNPGESLIPALTREVIEETGIKPSIGNLLYVTQFKTSNTEHLEFFFHVTNSGDFLNIDLSKTSHGYLEIDRISYIDTKRETVLPKFLSKEKFVQLENQHTKFFSYMDD